MSDCGGYRYTLYRRWNRDRDLFTLPIVMLSPSIADGTVDDRTIGRCIEFATREGFGGIHVVNMFAARATDPVELYDLLDPEGPDNAAALQGVAHAAAQYGVPILCAWGAHPLAVRRQPAVLDILGSFLGETVCLGTTKGGYPNHPLYLKGDQPFVRFP